MPEEPEVETLSNFPWARGTLVLWIEDAASWISLRVSSGIRDQVVSVSSAFESTPAPPSRERLKGGLGWR
jgi:hypothetical protein